MIHDASKQGSQVILFPELWTTGYDLENCPHYVEMNRQIHSSLADLAKEANIWIGGSQITGWEGYFRNTLILHNPTEDEPVEYSKLHLFGLMHEEMFLSPGEKPVAANLPWSKTGLAICYDLRFASLFAAYAQDGCPLTLLSAEWPVQRIQHWDILTQARAIEFQMFFAAVNAVGKTGDATYGGRSIILSPWGDILAQGSSTEEDLITTTIELDLVNEVRSHMSVLQDRRRDIFPEADIK